MALSKGCSLLFIVVLSVWAAFSSGSTPTTYAHHLGPKLPLVPSTPIIQHVIDLDHGEVVWGVDERASKYPNFIAQAKQVNDYGEEVGGIPHRYVEGFRSPSGVWTWPEKLDIIHTMPDVFGCGSGAHACIRYANPLPVIVEYNYRNGYTDERTAQCHEGTNMGHAMGLHEFYDDIDFTSNGRTDTCMDFGTGVWRMTPLDVANIHSWILPKQLKSYGIGRHGDGTGYVFYCDGEPNVSRRIAIMKEDFIFGRYWVGEYVKGGDGTVGVVGQGRCEGETIDTVPANPGDCFYLNAENGFNYKRGDLRNDTLVGCF